MGGNVFYRLHLEVDIVNAERVVEPLDLGVHVGLGDPALLQEYLLDCYGLATAAKVTEARSEPTRLHLLCPALEFGGDVADSGRA